MIVTNKLNLPQPIVEAVMYNDYTGGKADISVTRLIDSPLIRQLEKKHWDEIEEDASDRIYALMGKAMHEVLEKSDRNAITEKRIEIEVDGMTISGQFDRLALISDDGGIAGLLQDYKNSSVWEVIFGLKESREAQLNVYAYMLKRKGYRVTRLQAVLVLRDWFKSKSETDNQYPKHQVVVVDVPLWSEEKQLAYIKGRIAVHRSEVKECSDSEKWAKPTEYAVKKIKNKKARRKFDNIKDAENYLNKIIKPEEKKLYHIEIRPGEFTRCKSWCNVSSFCKYNIYNEANNAN